jgi:hypothetical protein
VKLASPSAKSGEPGTSLELDQVVGSYEQMMKAWRDAPARRSRAVWVGQLDRELTALGGQVTALAAVNGSERAAVASAVDRVRQQAERVRPLMFTHDSRLPPAMGTAWSRFSTLVSNLKKP